MNNDYTYGMSFEMSHDDLKKFYVTMAKAYKSWPGGDPDEQQLLLFLRDESWKLLLEAQFMG